MQSQKLKRTPIATEQLFEDALRLHKSGDSSKAKLLYREILKKNKDFSDAAANLAAILYAENKPKIARRLLTYTLKINKKPEYYKNLSVISWTGLNERDQAEKIINEGLAFFPNSAPLLFEKALILQDRQAYKEAIEIYKKIENNKEFRANVLSNLGVCCLELRNINKALRYQYNAIKIKPESFEIKVNLLAALMANREFTKVLKLYGTFSQTEKNRYESKIMYAALQFEMGDIFGCETICNELKKIFPEKRKIRHLLANVYIKDRRFEDAFNLLTELVENSPSDNHYMTDMIVVLMEREEYEQAKIFIEKLRNLGNATPRQKLIEASFEDMAGSFEAAKNTYKLASDLDRKNQKALWGFWRLLLIEEQELSLKILKKVLQYQYENDLWYDTASCIIAFGDPDLAVATWADQSRTIRKVLSTTYPTKQPESRDPLMVTLEPVGRAGSFFLQSLLDGHPEIINPHGAYLKEFLFDNYLITTITKIKEPQDIEDLIHLIFDRYDQFFNASSKKPLAHPIFKGGLSEGEQAGYTNLGPNRDRILCLPKAEVKKQLLSYFSNSKYRNNVTIQQTFLGLLYSIHRMIHNDKVDPRIILFHTHNPTNKNNLFLPQLFPNSKKLFITRDPEQSLERWIDIFYPQSSKKTNKIFAYRTIATIFHEFFSKIFHPSLYDNSCYILHLEDLKRAPHQVLKKFCTLFDLTWDPILLSTTVYGIEYHGIQNTQAISAADSSHLTSYAGKVFSERDRQRLNPLFNYMRKQYGYSYSEETIDKTLVQTSRELFDFEIKFCEMVEFPAEKLRETTIFHSVHKHYENMIHMVRDKSRALDNRRSFIRISG